MTEKSAQAKSATLLQFVIEGFYQNNFALSRRRKTGREIVPYTYPATSVNEAGRVRGMIKMLCIDRIATVCLNLEVWLILNRLVMSNHSVLRINDDVLQTRGFPRALQAESNDHASARPNAATSHP